MITSCVKKNEAFLPRGLKHGMEPMGRHPIATPCHSHLLHRVAQSYAPGDPGGALVLSTVIQVGLMNPMKSQAGEY